MINDLLHEDIFLKNIQNNTQNVIHETLSTFTLGWDETFAQRVSDKGPLNSTIKVIKPQDQHGKDFNRHIKTGCRSLAETQLQAVGKTQIKATDALVGNLVSEGMATPGVDEEGW